MNKITHAIIHANNDFSQQNCFGACAARALNLTVMPVVAIVVVALQIIVLPLQLLGTLFKWTVLCRCEVNETFDDFCSAKGWLKAVNQIAAGPIGALSSILVGSFSPGVNVLVHEALGLVDKKEMPEDEEEALVKEKVVPMDEKKEPSLQIVPSSEEVKEPKESKPQLPPKPLRGVAPPMPAADLCQQLDPLPVQSLSDFLREDSPAAAAAAPQEPFDSLVITPFDMQTLNTIYQKLADTSSLPKQLELRQLGDSIERLHPLKTLEFLALNEEARLNLYTGCNRNFPIGRLIKSTAIAEITANLMREHRGRKAEQGKEEYPADNLYRYLSGFKAALEPNLGGRINIKEVDKFFYGPNGGHLKSPKFEEFVHYIFERMQP